MWPTWVVQANLGVKIGATFGNSGRYSNIFSLGGSHCWQTWAVQADSGTLFCTTFGQTRAVQAEFELVFWGAGPGGGPNSGQTPGIWVDCLTNQGGAGGKFGHDNWGNFWQFRAVQ